MPFFIHSHTLSVAHVVLCYTYDSLSHHTRSFCYLHTLFVTHVGLRGMEKIMETVVRDTHFFINTELGHHLPVIQLLSFLPEIHVSSE